MKAQFTFHSDPGHGWLEVPLHEIKVLGLKVSDYSYYNGVDTVYLEEDGDATKFFYEFERAYDIKLKLKNKYYNRECFIRNYNFRLPENIREGK